MGKKFRKRIQALLLAVVLTVTALGSVCTVAAGSTAQGGSLIDFSFPFDFLFFHFGEAEETMTQEDLEAERNRLREQSMKAEKAAGLKLVYEYTMEEPQALSTLDLSGCKGDGTFVFAKPEFVPEKGVTVCEFIFTPNNVNAYDYDQILGWDKDTQTLRRYAEVICTSLEALEEEVTDASKEEDESVIPDAEEAAPEETPVPEEAPVPEATSTPEGTPTPEETKTPEETPTPDETPVPEATPESDSEVTPEKTPAPDETPTPETTPETMPEITSTPSKPSTNLIPEITAIPELVTPEAAPEVTPTPEPVVTAPIHPGIGNGVPIIEKEEAVKLLESQVLSFAQDDMIEEQMQALISLSNTYYALTEEQKNTVGSDVVNKLEALWQWAADVNHTSNGVTVSGNVPWYVQLRVELDNDTDTYVPTGLETIVPYDMCLWNLMTDTEYILAGAEKVTLTMAVPEEIHLYDGLTIVHYMDETHYEYIELKITGDTMSFETASFSPFNVAGSTILVGGNPGGSTKPSTTPKPTSTPKPTTKPSANNNKDDEDTKPVSKPSGNTSSGTTVKTGDDANITPFIMLGFGAAILIVLCILLIRRSKRDDK